MPIKISMQEPWEVVNTNQGYTVRGMWQSPSGATVRRYIAQLIPDKGIAKLMAGAKEMRNLLEDIAQYMETRYPKNTREQDLYHKICNLLRRLER